MEIKQLSFAADSPPLSVIAAAKLAGISLPTDASGSAPTFHFSTGLKLHGTNVLRYIGRVANLYGQNAYESGEIYEWLEYVLVFSSGSEFENGCNYVDKYLEKHTVVVGQCLSIADIATWSALAGTGQRWESLKKSKKNLVQWFNSVSTEYSDSLNEVTSMYVGIREEWKSQ